MRSPIHIVTPNPTFDLTYHLPRIELGEANRVTDVTRLSGGKGLNVARVLRDLGIEASVGGFVGGPRAQEFLAGVADLPAYFTLIDGPSRSTVSVIDESGSTSFNEVGPLVSEADVESLIETTLDLLASFGARAVLSLNGSNPPGTPIEAYSFLIARARGAGHIVVVDTSGEYLLAAAAAGAHVLKPNERELRAATGADTIAEGVSTLKDLGAGLVLLSLGGAGLQWHAAEHRPVHAQLPYELTGKSVGAGDALVAAALDILSERLPAVPGRDPVDAAALAHTLLTPADLPPVVATAAASVNEPVAGRLSPAVRDHLIADVVSVGL